MDNATLMTLVVLIGFCTAGYLGESWWRKKDGKEKS